VGPRVGLDAVVNRKISSPYRESKPSRPACNLAANWFHSSSYCMRVLTSELGLPTFRIQE